MTYLRLAISSGVGTWVLILAPVAATPVFVQPTIGHRSSATIIGIVGAGGIGLQLSEKIRTYDFDQVAFVIIIILVTVAAIDWICGKLRFFVIGRARPRHDRICPCTQLRPVDHC